MQLDSYITRIVEKELPENGVAVRRPGALRAWLTAYGAATATDASYTKILSAATAGEEEQPSRPSADSYREHLARIFILDPIPAWIPAFNPLKRLTHSPKHHLADPALAARLVGVGKAGLLRGEGMRVAASTGTWLGALFESLERLPQVRWRRRGSARTARAIGGHPLCPGNAPRTAQLCSKEPVGMVNGRSRGGVEMNARELLLDAYGRIGESVHAAIDGRSDEDLIYRPDPEANSIAWLIWHLARVQDDHIADVAGAAQVWTTQGFAERFGLPFDFADTGYGHSSEQVAQVRASASDLAAYYDAVASRTRDYLSTLEDADLDRIVDTRWDPPVTLGVRLVSVIGDDIAHAGQAAYVAGMRDRTR